MVETIKMKEKLISLAKEKGFMAILLRPIPYKEGTRWYSLESIRYYVWMCELQKWLRENYGIHINVDFGIGWGYQLIPVGWSGERFSEKFIDNKGWKTYEEALEESLKQGLMLIK